MSNPENNGAGPGASDTDAGRSTSQRPVDDGKEALAGDLPQSSVDTATSQPSVAPEMPHERDETVGITGGIPSQRVEQGYRDVQSGRQDTSRGPEADATYQKQTQAADDPKDKHRSDRDDR